MNLIFGNINKTYGPFLLPGEIFYLKGSKDNNSPCENHKEKKKRIFSPCENRNLGEKIYLSSIFFEDILIFMH